MFFLFFFLIPFNWSSRYCLKKKNLVYLIQTVVSKCTTKCTRNKSVQCIPRKYPAILWCNLAASQREILLNMHELIFSYEVTQWIVRCIVYNVSIAFIITLWVHILHVSCSDTDLIVLTRYFSLTTVQKGIPAISGFSQS